MKNQIERVKDIADGMEGIGGIPSNEEFYAEFNMRVMAALNITSNTVLGDSKPTKQICWKYGDKECDCKGLCRENC